MFVVTYPLDAWELLGDPSRRAIIERLSTGPCTVGGLAGDMPISRLAVSQHLKVLRDAGIVHDVPQGRNRVYSIDAQRLARYRHQLDQFWAGALGNLAQGRRAGKRNRMSIEPDGSVRHEVIVKLSQERAFWAFTDLDRIKPREHNMLAVPIEATVLEQQVGGDVYDRGIDGRICRWGRVLVFDPPRTIAFSWDIGPDWQVAADPTRTSEVTVSFTPDGNQRTRVTLVHRHLERHGAGWQDVRNGVDVDDGWPLYLARYQDLTREQDPA